MHSQRSIKPVTSPVSSRNLREWVHSKLFVEAHHQIGINVAISADIERDQTGVNLTGTTTILLRGKQSGLNISGVNQIRGAQVGVQIAGFNFIDRARLKDAKKDGGQIGLTVSLVNLVEGTQKGVSLAGIMNGASYIIGVAISPFLHCTRLLRGVTVSLLSITNEVRGVAIGGIVNSATKFRGVMIGLVTSVSNSKSSNGIQIGLLNIREDQRSHTLSFLFAISRCKKSVAVTKPAQSLSRSLVPSVLPICVLPSLPTIAPLARRPSQYPPQAVL